MSFTGTSAHVEWIAPLHPPGVSGQRAVLQGCHLCWVPHFLGRSHPCEAAGHKMETVHRSGPIVHARSWLWLLLGGCCARLAPEHKRHSLCRHACVPENSQVTSFATYEIRCASHTSLHSLVYPSGQYETHQSRSNTLIPRVGTLRCQASTTFDSRVVPGHFPAFMPVGMGCTLRKSRNKKERNVRRTPYLCLSVAQISVGV